MRDKDRVTIFMMKICVCVSLCSAQLFPIFILIVLSIFKIFFPGLLRGVITLPRLQLFCEDRSPNRLLWKGSVHVLPRQSVCFMWNNSDRGKIISMPPTSLKNCHDKAIFTTSKRGICPVWFQSSSSVTFSVDFIPNTAFMARRCKQWRSPTFGQS
jgi:hypothetical protein